MSAVASQTPSYPSPLSKQNAVDIEPDEAWKVALKERIEEGLSSMVAEVKKKLHDELDREIVSTLKREELTREYHNSMNSIRLLAQETFQNELERERQERRWITGGEMLPQWNEALKQEQQDIMDRIKVAQKEAASPVTGQSPSESDGLLDMPSAEQKAESPPKRPVPVKLPPDLAEKREKQLREERKEKERNGRERKQAKRRSQEKVKEQEKEEERVAEAEELRDQAESASQQELEPEHEQEAEAEPQRGLQPLRGMASRRGSVNRAPTSGWDENLHPPMARPRQPRPGIAERQDSPSEESSGSDADLLLRPPERSNLSRKSSMHDRPLDSPTTRSTEHLSRLSSERYPPRSPPTSHSPQFWKPSSPEEDIRPPSAGLARRNSSTSIRSTGSGSHRPTIAESIPERSDSEAEHGEQRGGKPDHPWSNLPLKPREKERRREHRKSSASDQNRLEDPSPPFSSARTPHRHEDPYPPPQSIRERYEDPPASHASPRVPYRPEEIGPRLPPNMRSIHHKASFTAEEWDFPYQPPRSVRNRPSFDDRHLHSQPPTPSRVISRPPSIPSEERERGYYDQVSHRQYQTPPTSANRSASGRDYAPPQGWYPNRTDSTPSYGYSESRSNTYKFAQQPESPPKRRSSESRPNQNRDPSYTKAFSDEPYQQQSSPADTYNRQYERSPSASIPISRNRHSPALEETEGWKFWSSEVSASLPRRDQRWESEWRGGHVYDRDDMPQSREQGYSREDEREHQYWEPGRDAGHAYGRQHGPPLEPERREYSHQVFPPSSFFPSKQEEVPSHAFGGRDHYYPRDSDEQDNDYEDMGSEQQLWENHDEEPDLLPEGRSRHADMRGIGEFRVKKGQERSNQSIQREKKRKWELEVKRQEEAKKQEEARQQEEETRRLEEEEEEERQLAEEEERRLAEEERRLAEEARRLEEKARRNQEEATRKAEEARKLQEEARKKAEEVKKLQEAKKKAEEEAKKLEKKEAEIRRKELETKRKAEEVRKKEEEASKKEREAKRKEAEAQKKEVEAKRKEEEAGRKEEEARKKENDARQKEEEAHRRELEAQNKEQEARKKEEEMRQKEEELKKREEEILRREQEIASQKEAERLQREWDLEEEQKRMDDKFRKDQEEFDRRAQEILQKAGERKRQDSVGMESNWSPSSYTSSQNQRTHPQMPNVNGQAPGWSNNARSSPKSSATSGPSTSTPSLPKSRSGSTNSTFPTMPNPSLDESEWRRRNEEQYQKQQERFREEQQRYENARQRAQSSVLSKEESMTLFNHHERQWNTLVSSNLGDLHWESIPWPMFKTPKVPEEITMTAVSAYMQSQYFPEKDKSKTYKDRLKEHIRRWHPDRFETKYLSRVVEEDRERVKDGAGSVVRTLNELLTRSNAPKPFS